MSDNLMYVSFVSADPRLDFSFLYPSAWRIVELHEQEYSQVLVSGPRNQQDTYSVGLAITARPESAVNLQNHVVDHLAKAHQAREFKLIAQAQGFLSECAAIETLTCYHLALPLNSVVPTNTVILERRIALIHAPRLYEITYRADEANYSTHLSAFETVARTFHFEDTPSNGSKIVFVPPRAEPVLIFAEKRADYEAKK